MIYVFDRGYAGAYVLVASSRQEAADRLRAEYPQGFQVHGSQDRFFVDPEDFLEYADTEVVRTDGDI